MALFKCNTCGDKDAKRKVKRNKSIVVIAVPVVCVLIPFIVVLNAVIIPSSKYNDAVALMEAGNLDEAYSIFQELGDYKDAVDKAGNIRLMRSKKQLENVKAGDYIKFGAYEQDNNISNGKEIVEWIVLEVRDGKALVVSKYALDCKQYNTSYRVVTWSSCSLCKWLNNDFINAAFTANEKAVISTVTVSADENPVYTTDPGKTTQDQVFLLSITEVYKYFSSDSARQCEPTDYAVANGERVNAGNSNCLWWLRSPGFDQGNAAAVDYDGNVVEYGSRVDTVNVAVRPALWIDLSKI